MVSLKKLTESLGTRKNLVKTYQCVYWNISSASDKYYTNNTTTNEILEVLIFSSKQAHRKSYLIGFARSLFLSLQSIYLLSLSFFSHSSLFFHCTVLHSGQFSHPSYHELKPKLIVYFSISATR